MAVPQCLPMVCVLEWSRRLAIVEISLTDWQISSDKFYTATPRRWSYPLFLAYEETYMRLFALIALTLTLSATAFAEAPVSLKERVKWDLWVEGVSEFQASSSEAVEAQSQKPLPEEITRVLNRLQL